MKAERNWKPYEPGQVIKEAGIRVIRCIFHGPTQRTTKYLVVYLCHNSQEQVEMTHRTIREKAGEIAGREPRPLCPSCSRLKVNSNREKKRAAGKLNGQFTAIYGVWNDRKDHSLWPVPPSILTNPPTIRIA